MSFANEIKPFLLEADRRRPDLKITNTALSCFELLQLTLALAGNNWAFIGKTRDMDGASVTPVGFEPRDMLLTRPDGQRQNVHIVGVSMDAAWHIPSRTQVKVIANSSANDDANPAIHGPARPVSLEARAETHDGPTTAARRDETAADVAPPATAAAATSVDQPPLVIQSLPAVRETTHETRAVADVPPQAPWTTAADAGVAVGRTSQKAAVATAGFFTRVSKRVAGAF
jgi:hypothetical protein